MPPRADVGTYPRGDRWCLRVPNCGAAARRQAALWHCQFFYWPDNEAVLRAMMRKYALAVDGDEAGAHARSA
ncbi:phage replication domain protein [Burkholderia pseudomallei]|nr:phage replication domain protein [Burkholderia pseudomallei]